MVEKLVLKQAMGQILKQVQEDAFRVESLEAVRAGNWTASGRFRTGFARCIWYAVNDAIFRRVVAPESLDKF